MKHRAWSRGERMLLFCTLLVPLAIGVGTYVTSVLRARNGITLRTNNGIVLCLAWAPDSRTLIAGGRQGSAPSLLAWDTITGQLEQSFAGHTSAVYNVGFSPDGRQWASSSEAEVCLWDTKSQSLKQKFPIRSVGYFDWKKQGQALGLVGWPAHTVNYTAFTNWQIDTATGTVTSKLIPINSHISTQKPSQEKAPEGQFTLERLPGQTLVTTLRGKPVKYQGQSSFRVRAKKDNKILYENIARNFAQLWWQDKDHLEGIASITSNGRLLEAQLWDFDCQTRHETWQPLEVENLVTIHVSPDKRWLSWDEYHQVQLFDLKKRSFVATWSITPRQQTRSEFSPDSRALAWLDGDAVRVQQLARFSQEE